MWELRHKGGVNHQPGTKAKAARRKLGPRPRPGPSAHPAGWGHAGWARCGLRKSQSCWQLLVCRGERQGTHGHASQGEALPSRATQGPLGPGEGAQSIEAAGRLLGGADPVCCGPGAEQQVSGLRGPLASGPGAQQVKEPGDRKCLSRCGSSERFRLSNISCEMQFSKK